MTTMTLDELIERLTEIREEVADTLSDTAASDAEMRVAVNPAWAMQHGLERQLTWRGRQRERRCCRLSRGRRPAPAGNPYLPGEISEQLGWS
jgi:3-methyladenine DNA glycosylase AlkC